MHKHISSIMVAFILNMWHDHSESTNTPRLGVSPVEKVIFV